MRAGAGEAVLSDVTGAKTEALLPAGTSELVAQLNSAARGVPIWPWALALTAFLTVALPWLALVLVPLTAWLAWRDQVRRTVVAFYEVDGPAQARYQALVDCFQVALRSRAAWHVVAHGALGTPYQRKVNAGAGSLVQRKPMPSLRSASRSVYFVPDRLLVLDHRTYADVPYEEGRWPGGARRG